MKMSRFRLFSFIFYFFSLFFPLSLCLRLNRKLTRTLSRRLNRSQPLLIYQLHRLNRRLSPAISMVFCFTFTVEKSDDYCTKSSEFLHFFSFFLFVFFNSPVVFLFPVETGCAGSVKLSAMASHALVSHEHAMYLSSFYITKIKSHSMFD